MVSRSSNLTYGSIHPCASILSQFSYVVVYNLIPNQLVLYALRIAPGIRVKLMDTLYLNIGRGQVSAWFGRFICLLFTLPNLFTFLCSSHLLFLFLDSIEPPTIAFSCCQAWGIPRQDSGASSPCSKINALVSFFKCFNTLSFVKSRCDSKNPWKKLTSPPGPKIPFLV